IPASRQLMPLAFATGFGGFSALIGTPPNMIVTEALSAAGFRPFGFFEFAWLGVPVAFAGMLYMDVVGRRILPSSCSIIPPPEPGSRVHGNPVKMWICALILLSVILVMTLEIPGVSLESVAVTGAVLCVLTGCLSGAQAIK